MKISLLSFNNQYYNNYQQQQKVYLQPLKQDTVCFTAMKKSQFQGFELAAIEKFKAPIEKFNSNEDFQDWAVNKIFDINEKSYGGRNERIIIQRMAMLNNWFNYVVEENTSFSPAIALIITDAVRKDLKDNNDNIPPVLNKQVLNETINELTEILKRNPKESFDFNKMYRKQLREFYIEDIDTKKQGTKWVKIPSKIHDAKNFDANVEKLQMLSHDNWCTKTTVAEEYLEEGDFHIYLKNGKPEAAIRLEGDKICEIKIRTNTSDIAAKYMADIMEYINRENLNLLDYD